MDRTERFYHIDRLLNERRVVPVQVFLNEPSTASPQCRTCSSRWLSNRSSDKRTPCPQKDAYVA